MALMLPTKLARRSLLAAPALLLPHRRAEAQFSGQHSGFWSSGGGNSGSGGGSPPPPPPTLRKVPLAAYLTTYPSNSGSNYYGSLSAHWTGFISALGVTPTIFGGAINSNEPGTFSCTPDTWPGTISSQTSNLSFLPGGTALMTTWNWQNNSGTSLYNDMATVTNTSYGGHLIAYWVQQALATWKAAGYTTLYLRPNWEWNDNASWAQTPCAAGVSAAVFVQAFQNFYTTCHTYAAANGMTVYICWDPSVYGQSDPCGDSLASQFPNQTAGDNFVDVVCADFYAESGSAPTFTSGSPSVWALTSCFNLAASWNVAVGFCELGGLKYPSGGSSAAGTFIPDVISYINSIGATVSCAFAALWDVNTGLDATSNLEFTAPGASQSGIIAAWKTGLGPTGTMQTIS